MTKQEFITGYCNRSGLDEYRTDYGFSVNGQHQLQQGAKQ